MNATQLTAAISFWMNLLGKGPKETQEMTIRTIEGLQARLAAL